MLLLYHPLPLISTTGLLAPILPHLCMKPIFKTTDRFVTRLSKQDKVCQDNHVSSNGHTNVIPLVCRMVVQTSAIATRTPRHSPSCPRLRLLVDIQTQASPRRAMCSGSMHLCVRIWGGGRHLDDVGSMILVRTRPVRTKPSEPNSSPTDLTPTIP